MNSELDLFSVLYILHQSNFYEFVLMSNMAMCGKNKTCMHNNNIK